MRLLRVILLLVGLLPLGALAASEGDLRLFARSQGLVDVVGFIETVQSLRQTSRLPRRYVTKEEAQRLGWRPGDDLCDVARGRTIGGNRFGNRERRLPEKKDRKYYEADLDFACGKRGAKRLVWSNDGLMYVTVDHYDTFQEVPR